MMLVYIKQAWQLLKQNRFYSAIYIFATALSISLVMILAIIFYIKIANIYPETNRSRLLTLEYIQVTTPDERKTINRYALEMIRKCVYPLETAEAVSGVYALGGTGYVQIENSDEQMAAKLKYVDVGFWNVFSFSFLEGAPFTHADMESGIRTVVVSEAFARRIFGTANVTGKYLNLDFNPYRICGVVKEPSYIADKTYAQLWIPYTAKEGMITAWGGNVYKETIGPFMAYILAPSNEDIAKVKAEVQANVNRYASSLEGIEVNINDQPDRQWQSLFRISSRFELDFTQLIMQYGVVFFIFLLIPAISLSGIADSQLERRLSEMGVRRTFGATKGSLMKQLIGENLLFTGFGGLLGLLISYLVIYNFRKWIIHIGMGQLLVSAVPEDVDVMLPTSMLMNYTVFGIALGVCLILNMMVTIIPAWNTTRRQIVYSLNK